MSLSYISFVDPLQAHAGTVARGMAIVVVMLTGLLGVVTERLTRSSGLIWMNRGSTSRQQLAVACARHPRYLIFPEGTRRANKPNADEVVDLRPGGLKNIFEAKDDAHIVVTVDKELLMNEARVSVGFCVTLYRARHPPIAAVDYPTFEAFLDAVNAAWRTTWARAHALRAERQGGGGGKPPTRAAAMV